MRVDHPWRIATSAGAGIGRLATPAQIELALIGAMVPVQAIIFARESQPLGATLLTLTAGAAATIIWDATRSVRSSRRDDESARLRLSRSGAKAGAAHRETPAERMAETIAETFRLSGHASLAVVTIRGADHDPGAHLAAARRHVESTVRRVSRGSDIIVGLDERRVALILSGCDGADAAGFGQRLAVAVHNRPAGDAGAVSVNVTTLEYDPARFGTANRFLAAFGLAATSDTAEAQSPARALDGHDIRRRILGDGFANYRPGGFGGLVRVRFGRPLRVIA